MKIETYDNHGKKTIFWAFIIILIGLVLLFNNLDIIDIKDLLKDYWPVLLILWGLYLIMKRDRYHFDNGITGDKDFICETEKAFYSNVFGDLQVEINSQNFEEGKINTTFGDIGLDLSKLNIKSGQKILDIHGVFGDIKVSVPQNIEFSITASITAGDIKIMGNKVDGFSKELKYQSKNYDTANSKLMIHVSHVFGDIKVW
jgi:lia operon protein LiaF